MLYIRLEKLRFVVMEMRLAMRLAQFAPTDADAYRLSDDQLAAIESVKSAGDNPAENEP